MAESETQQQPLVPTHGASHFGLAINQLEILLTLGHSRVAMDVENGVPTPRPLQEWFLTLAMSPQAAKTLAGLLQQAVSEYERQFGKLPAVEAVTMNRPPGGKAP
jgi:hypothetical protein